MDSHNNPNSLAKNDGSEESYFLQFGQTKQKIGTVLNVSILAGKVHFDKTAQVFSLMVNEDIVSLIPKKPLKVNSKGVSPNQMFILEVGDVIKSEDIEFKIVKEKVVIEIEEPFVPHQTSSINVDDLLARAESSPESRPQPQALSHATETSIPPPPGSALAKKQKVKKQQPRVKKKTIEAKPSALNALPRVFAIIFELIIASLITEALTLGELLSPLKEAIAMDTVLKPIQGLGISSAQVFGIMEVIICFYLLRVFSALLFGVSLGQALIAARSSDPNLIVKRLKAVTREIIGIFTWPFLIFDLPALISNRTLKEVITFSRVEGRGFIISLLLIIFNLCWTLGLFALFPIVNFEGSLDAVGVKQTSYSTNRDAKDYSYVNLYETYISNENTALPFFSYKTERGKFLYRPKIKFLRNNAELATLGPLDYKALLTQLRSEHKELIFFYPTIFRDYLGTKSVSQAKLAKALAQFNQQALGLNLSSIGNYMSEQLILTKAYLRYRELLKGKLSDNFTDLEIFSDEGKLKLMLKISNRFAIIMSLDDSTQPALRMKHNGFAAGLIEISKEGNDSLQLVQLIDLLNRPRLNLEKAFEVSFEFLKEHINQEVNKPKIVTSFRSQIDYLNAIKKDSDEEIDKYVQNLSDALTAFENEELSYFGPSDDVQLPKLDLEPPSQVETIDE